LNILTAETHIGYRRRLAHGHETAKYGLRRYVPRLEYAKEISRNPGFVSQNPRKPLTGGILPAGRFASFLSTHQILSKTDIFSGGKTLEKASKKRETNTIIER